MKLRTLLVVASSMLLFAACGPSRTEQIAEATAKRDQARADITEATLAGVRKAQIAGDCTNDGVKNTFDHLNLNTSLRTPDTPVGSHMFDANLWLETGDILREMGCNDRAIEAYSSVVEIYVGGAYQGLRDRALLGIQLIQNS